MISKPTKPKAGDLIKHISCSNHVMVHEIDEKGFVYVFPDLKSTFWTNHSFNSFYDYRNCKIVVRTT